MAFPFLSVFVLALNLAVHSSRFSSGWVFALSAGTYHERGPPSRTLITRA